MSRKRTRCWGTSCRSGCPSASLVSTRLSTSVVVASTTASLSVMRAVASVRWGSVRLCRTRLLRLRRCLLLPGRGGFSARRGGLDRDLRQWAHKGVVMNTVPTCLAERRAFIARLQGAPDTQAAKFSRSINLDLSLWSTHLGQIPRTCSRISLIPIFG